MLTNNFYEALALCLTKITRYSAVKSVTGSIENLYWYASSSYAAYYSLNAFFSVFNTPKVTTAQNSAGFALGTGEVSPALDDYWLSGEQLTNIGLVASQLSAENSDGALKYKVVLTVQNNGEESVTIREIATVCQMYKTNSSSVIYVLTDRIVLDTPLALAAGEQGVITYTLELPFA